MFERHGILQEVIWHGIRWTKCFQQTLQPVLQYTYKLIVGVYSGLVTEKERKILKILSLRNRDTKLQSLNLDKPLEQLCKDACSEERDFEAEQNVYYVPLLWAADLVNQAHDDGRIKDGHALTVLIQVGTVAECLNTVGYKEGFRGYKAGFSGFNPSPST